jgi:hypothetical protein
MCYSAKSSMIGYTLGTVFSILLYKYGDKYDKHIALFSLVFVQIQLAEFFMWIDQKCGKLNDIATRFANLIIYLQPLSIILGAVLFKTTKIPKSILFILLIFLFIVFIRQLVYNLIYIKQLCSKQSYKGHLNWDFINKRIGKPYLENKIEFIIYFSLMLLTWLFLYNIKKGLLIFILLTIFVIYSGIRIKNKKLNVLQQWESVWCIQAVSIPIIFLFIKYLKLF